MRISIFLCFCCLTYIAKAQYQVRGKVSDNNLGKTLMNVTVRSPSTTTITNNLGEFMIGMKQGENQLFFSMVGYRTDTILVNGKDNRIEVRLVQVDQQLEEVTISTGYEKMKLGKGTGAINFIDRQRFNEQQGAFLMDRLPAIANGLVLDKSTSNTGTLLVRGLSTISGPKNPLIVLDNFPYEGDLSNINPDIVESITILKDAASSAIWGARAGNGVIVITTKSAKYDQPLRSDISVLNTVISKPDLSYLRQLSSSSFIDIEEELYRRNYYNSAINSASKPQLSPAVELMVKRDAGAISSDVYQSLITELRQFDVRDDFQKYFYQRGHNQQYSLNLSSGSRRQSWIMNLGHNTNRSTLDAVYNRSTLKFNQRLGLGSHFEIDWGLNFAYSKDENGKPGYGDILASVSGLYPYARFADADGNALPLAKRRQEYIDSAGWGKLLDWNYYPLNDYTHRDNNRLVTDLQFNLGIKYRLFDGLSVGVNMMHENQRTDGNDLFGLDGYFARDMINKYSQVASQNSAVIYNVPVGAIKDRSVRLLNNFNLRAQANYAKRWGSHELNSIVGYEQRSVKVNSQSDRTYGYDPETLIFGNVDYTRTYPEFVNGTPSFIPDNSSFSSTVNNYLSTYINGNYTFREKYSLSLSARRDASNLFGVLTNDKWTPLWSTGASWLISQEKFYNSPLVPFLRLKASYGLNGNVNPGMSAVSTIRYAGTNPFIPNTPYAQFSQYANPELSWETSRSMNIGLEFKTKASRLSGSFDYYRKKGENLYGYEQLDYTGGIGTNIIKNTASILGRGLDVELNSVNVKGNVFSWSTHINFSYNRDKVISYYLLNRTASFFVGDTYAVISAIPGTPVYSIYSYRWAGLDPSTGDPLGYYNGQVSKNYADLTSNARVEDLKFHGPATPVYFGSVGNTFAYGDFSLSVRLMFKMGYYFRRSTTNYTNLLLNYQNDKDYDSRWQKSGDELNTYIPSISYTTNISRDRFFSGSEPLVERGDHVRLQYVTLNYAPKNKPKIGSVQYRWSVYLNVNDVGLIWARNRHGIDPDSRGANVLAIPMSFTFGLRAALN